MVSTRFVQTAEIRMTCYRLFSITSLVLAGFLASFSEADIYLQNPRGSNNRLNENGDNRNNNNRLFDSQNNNKGGYNVGDKDGASKTEKDQFNMHYFQSGSIGKSQLTIEWTNQHGCGDRDLNCNFVLQYRCQDDTKHKTLKHNTMRNGGNTETPSYNKKTLNTRQDKEKTLQAASDLSRGLHEPWEWYDKCAKRQRNKEGKKCSAKTTSGLCCVFPFTYRGKQYTTCTTVDNGNKLWCATTSNYDKDKRWGNCANKQGKCLAKTTTGQCCVFPFTYKRKSYTSCTTVDNGHRLWCATTSNYDKDKKWGNCAYTQGKCLVKTTTGQCCVFPFIYKRKLYTACTTANYGNKLWCATTSNYDRDRRWGKCDSTKASHNIAGGYIQSGVGGLFTADQNLQGDASIYTRQNANGGRSGYECPEERDYYPYWHPTDWIDIAVFAQNQAMCHYYQRESFNVRSKGECLEYYPTKSDGFRHYSNHNNKFACEINKGIWVQFSNYLEEYPQQQTEAGCKSASTRKFRLIWAIPYRSEDIDKLKMVNNNVESLKRCLVALNAPECKVAPRTRTNHLGNADGVVPLRYNWKLPYYPSGHAQRCVFRIRYNISTGDYPPYNTFSDKNKDASPIKNNPTVDVGDPKVQLQLAINTAQFGRTFQDRSHLFKLVPRPSGVSDKDFIFNLNVRGKRGNIVQVYPAVEYDFFPKRMSIPRGSLVHIQWTGSNTNPQNNAGQGTAGTDRNNIVEMKEPSVNYPLTSGNPLQMFTNAQIVWSGDSRTQTTKDLIVSMASSGFYYNAARASAQPSLNAELNNAPASYRGMLLKFSPGTYYYMCTRNNNFSNRNQKGRLHVMKRDSTFFII